MNLHLVKEIRNQQDQNWTLKEQLYLMKKERDDIMDELMECAERISLLEKVAGYKLRGKMLS